MATTSVQPPVTVSVPNSTTNPSSTLPNSSGVPASSTTSADPVTVALNKLSKTAVANLWEEKVTSAPWYTKLFGLIGYLWNKSTAAAADKQFGATIQKFNTAATELVQSVARRAFTPEEAAAFGVNPVQFNNTNEQLLQAQCISDAKNKLEAFYSVFKERVAQLDVNENDTNGLGIYAAAAQKAINDLSESKKVLPDLKYPATFSTKIQTTLQEFNGRIFDDMVNAYANQPIANITIGNFKQKVALIKGFFSAIDNVDIEAKLRQAIKRTHHTDALDAIRDEFTNAAADAPRFVEAKTQIEAKLNADKLALQGKLDELRGPNGWNGTIDAAFQARQQAEAAMNQAFTALIVAFQQPANNVDQNDQARTIALITQFLDTAKTSGLTNIANLQQLLTDYNQKAVDFQAKKQAHEAKLAELAEIAQYDNTGNMTAGKIFDIDANLQPAAVDAAARAETRKNASFYTELNLVVGENNKVARSQALNRILG